MARDDDGAALVGQVPHEIAQLNDALRIQSVLGLVEDEDLRVGQKCHSQGQTHLHARGEGAGTLPADSSQPDTLQERGNGLRRGTGQTAVDEQVASRGQLGEKGGPVNGGPHLGQATTGERSPLNLHTSGVGREQPQGDVESGRLARPVEAEQPIDATGIGRQVQIGQNLLATERLGNAGEPQPGGVTGAVGGGGGR